MSAVIEYIEDETAFSTSKEDNLAVVYETIVCRIPKIENELDFARMQCNMLRASLDPDEDPKDDPEIMEYMTYIDKLTDKLVNLNHIRQVLFDRGKRRTPALLAWWRARH